MVPKTSKKTKEPKAKPEGPHHRAARLDNARELVCPECWTVPPTIRKDGVTVPRHQAPEGSKARRFKNTDRCNGQGRIARYVVDDPWEIGSEPKVHISALEYVEHGTSKIDKRQAEAEAKAKRAEERAATPKKPKEAKPKAPKPKAEPKAAKAKPRNRKAKAKASSESGPTVAEPVTAQPPAAA